MRGGNKLGRGGLFPRDLQVPHLLPPGLPLCAAPRGYCGHEEMEDSSGLEISNCFLSTEYFSKSQMYRKGIQWRGGEWVNNPWIYMVFS